MNPSFWHKKRVFLTGHTGFKGGWMSLWLQSLGAEVTGYALAPSTLPNLFDEANIGEGMKSIIGDVRDLPTLQKAMQHARPEIVIHMAAQPLVRYSYLNPVETYATNVMGTVHLLESLRQIPEAKAAVVVTTDKCYENREWEWGYRENEPMGGHDPYSSSKGCAELICSAYRSSYFSLNTSSSNQNQCAIGTARAGNVIGGGDWSQDRLIPDVLRSFEQKQSVEIRNPLAIRPWQHVMEPLRGYLTLAERLYQDGQLYAEGWNFGPINEDSKPVGWLVEQMVDMWGTGAGWTVSEAIHPHEAHSLMLDISKARNRLNWRPVLHLKEALQLTVDWVRQRQCGANIQELTLGQLKTYQTSING
jgi:CDP-glucose 4,6-dehydratase